MSGDTGRRWTVEDFDLLQMVCMDLSGVPRGKLIPKTVARDFVDKNGFEFFSLIHCAGHACDIPMSIPEFAGNQFDNYICVPVMDTLVELPWVSKPGRRVGQVMCHMVLNDGRPEPSTVRFQVDRKMKQLEMLGYSMSSSFKCQFTVFKSGTECQEFLGSEERNKTTPYSSIGAENLMLDLCDQLKGAGVNVNSWQRRKGRGAFELSIAPTGGTAAADSVSRLKQGVRGFTASRGYQTTFMTQPMDADTGSTCSFRFTIRAATGQSVFFDGAKQDRISDVAHQWIAGMLHHGAAMTALWCPTVNCYKRKAADDTQTPQRLDWGIHSSVTFLSVHVTGSDVWIETRMPSSASNPYFVLLATLAAGLDGLQKEMECPEKLSLSAASVPDSLDKALDALEADAVLEEALSPFLLKCFIVLKRESEITKYKELDTAEDKEAKIKELEKNLYLTRL